MCRFKLRRKASERPTLRRAVAAHLIAVGVRERRAALLHLAHAFERVVRQHLPLVATVDERTLKVSAKVPDSHALSAARDAHHTREPVQAILSPPHRGEPSALAFGERAQLRAEQAIERVVPHVFEHLGPIVTKVVTAQADVARCPLQQPIEAAHRRQAACVL